MYIGDSKKFYEILSPRIPPYITEFVIMSLPLFSGINTFIPDSTTIH